MVRLFKTNNIRKIEEISGLWDFNVAGSDTVCKMPVPACWEMFPGYETFRGQAVYRKTVTITEQTNLRLVFKGVSHTGRVFFNGVYIGEHYNAYTPFDFVIPNVTPGEHEIKVEVDNSFGEHSALHMHNDYYTYGGITRPVVIEYLPNAYIERIEFIPTHNGTVWTAAIKAYVKQISNFNGTPTVRGKINDINFELTKNDEIDDYIIFSTTITVANAKAWSTEDPNLYLLNLTLLENGTAIDDLIERVGFREVTVQGEKILLNGKQIFLTGFNRHEDHAGYGCAIGFTALMKDISLLKDLNSNTVRTSHYPNDELFLDLCDEHGLYVWEENHARGLSLEKMQNPNFEKQCYDCNDEMVKNHFNHPSIIIWGILNECASNCAEGREMYAKQIAQIKALDATRLVSFATHFKYRDVCLDLPDIVSWNLYYGWYDDPRTAQLLGKNEYSSAEAFAKLVEYSDNDGGAGKPMLITEFGAGAIPGYRDRRRVKWSEERQCDILEDNLNLYLNHERLSGAIIWQFCDCLVTEGQWFAQRPRTKNNKGVVDEFRRPKLAYDTVKNMFGENKR